MLRGLADQHIDRRWFGIFGLALFDDGLYGIAQKLSKDVFQMTQDVGKRGVEVSVDVDLGYVDMRAVCALDEFLGSLAARLDDLFGVAS